MFEEHKYKELKKLGTELHIPIFESFLKLEVFDKDDNLIQKHSQRSHSWVRNAYNHLFSQLASVNAADSTFAAGKLSIRDTGGTVRYSTTPLTIGTYNVSLNLTTYGYLGSAGDATQGIVIGTGIGAESFEGYALGTLVASGSAATQMDYSAQKAHAITYTAGTKVLKNDLIRYFNNNSGGSIVIGEVGMYTHSFVGGTARDWMQCRDLLGATITVADTGQLRVTYTIQITFAG